jgi:hypothetical protein
VGEALTETPSHFTTLMGILYVDPNAQRATYFLAELKIGVFDKSIQVGYNILM